MRDIRVNWNCIAQYELHLFLESVIKTHYLFIFDLIYNTQKSVISRNKIYLIKVIFYDKFMLHCFNWNSYKNIIFSLKNQLGVIINSLRVKLVILTIFNIRLELHFLAKDIKYCI
ncbi:hypothetical protein QVD17_07820 [Tagetes erecta]|uniref:Uncharacterized protein n=1 Tax=Tagetes erecta TaxID=13708 RepID=A0AAD8L1K8_TARER|nr:hypothetical protein QVD17_07820 [Tagetes erecta]